MFNNYVTVYQRVSYDHQLRFVDDDPPSCFLPVAAVGCITSLLGIFYPFPRKCKHLPETMLECFESIHLWENG